MKISREKFGELLGKSLAKILDALEIEVGSEPILAEVEEVDLREAARRLVLASDPYDANDDELFAARIRVTKALKAEAVGKKVELEPIDSVNPDESSPLLDEFRNVLRKAGVNI